MRHILLTSATLCGLICLPAMAQTTSPDQSALPDAGTATDVTTSGGAPASPMHHHRAVKPMAGDDGQIFAHEPGTGQSGPASSTSSNIDAGDTRSAIAPHLPEPAAGLNAGWRDYLHAAEQAMAMRKSGLAQQSLEMAETRLLDRSTLADAASQPDGRPLVARVSNARRALASGKFDVAKQEIDMALAASPGSAAE